MMTKPEDFAKSGFNFALFFANTTFEGIERLALLNLAAARSVFEASLSNMTSLLGAKDVQSLVSIQKDISAPSIWHLPRLVLKWLLPLSRPQSRAPTKPTPASTRLPSRPPKLLKPALLLQPKLP